VTVRYTVLSHKAISGWAVLIIAVGVGMAVWLLLAYGRDDPRVQLDAIRTAGTVVVGAGGAGALLLAARRQRATEIALKQKDRDQAATDVDATERRITELYTRAAEQLGSDKAPVRLAGLYALERLAQNNPTQRQTIVNVLCAYLRVPFTLPDDPSRDHAIPDDVAAQHRKAVEEREVRLTAQRVLTTHLRPGDMANPVDTFWTDIDLDLTGAVLIKLDLNRCHLRTAQFVQATFAGHAWFDEAEFAGNASFDQAEFAGFTAFTRSEFVRIASFRKAHFANDALFGEAEFAGLTWFEEAEFAGNATFDSVKFARDTSFDSVTFASDALFSAFFDKAEFAGNASFRKVEFASDTTADAAAPSTASFPNRTSFTGVVFAQAVPAEVRRIWSWDCSKIGVFGPTRRAEVRRDGHCE
jgi:hypothetical protein